MLTSRRAQPETIAAVEHGTSDAELVENQIAEVGAEETIAGLLRVIGNAGFKSRDWIAPAFGVRIVRREHVEPVT